MIYPLFPGHAFADNALNSFNYVITFTFVSASHFLFKSKSGA